MADWPTIASLATAGGTLVLAAATFASVRSANRAARTAERSMLAGLRPLLLGSRTEDPSQKVMWADRHFAYVPGGRAVVEVDGDAIYLAGSVRNAGAGVAVLDGWRVQLRHDGDMERSELDAFRRLTRDLYVPVGDVGFWQGAIRDVDDPDRATVLAAIDTREILMVDVLYGDQEGGQRTITRFSLTPVNDGWLFAAGRHWNIDRDDPR